MSNRDSDARYEKLPQALKFHFEQAIKDLHTVLPGLVRSYNPTTKRMVIQPSINLLMTNGRSVEKPPIVNVPVMQRATGTHMMHHQIDPGDVCLLLFSERGLEKFKQRWGTLSDPTVENFFSEKDALAVPWGVETINPVRTPAGWCRTNPGRAMCPWTRLCEDLHGPDRS